MKCLCKLIALWFVILALFIVFPLLGGCAGPNKSDRLSKLLKLMPANDNIRGSLITLTDAASALEDVDISLTELDEQSVTFQEFIDMILDKEIRISGIPMGSGSDIVGWGTTSINGTIIDKYVGYNYASLDAEILAGVPPNEVLAAIGRYDPEANRKALENQDDWPAWAVEAYTTEEYRGVTIHSWGDGFKNHLIDSLTPPHLDALGRARPLAVTDEYLFYAASVDTVKSMIDSSQDKVESLADLPEYAEIVGKMSGMGVNSVTLGNESWVNGDPDYEGTYPGPRLKKFLAFGSGTGQDTNGYYTVLILYHENRDDAESNISLLEQRIAGTDSIFFENPWSELITDAEIEVDGQTLIAKFYPARGILTSLVYGHDILLLHEQ